jgi:hypothetical protein
MNKKIFLLGIVMTLVLATSAFAWWIYGSQEVLTCNDTDGNNIYTAGSIFGYDLNMTYYNQTDYCTTNNTVGEFGCYTQPGTNKTYGVLYGEDCTLFNMTCSMGRCV